MSENFIPALIGMVGGVVSALATVGIALYTTRSQRGKTKAEEKKTNADAADQIGDAALALLKPYQERVQELRGELGELRDKLTRMEYRVESLEDELKEEKREKGDILSGAQRLYHQLVSHDIIPMWIPPGCKIYAEKIP